MDQQFTPSGWVGRYLGFIKVNVSCHLKKHIWGKGHFRSLEATGDIQYWAGFQIQNLSEDISSVHFSHSVVSSSLQPHGLQHDRPSCPSPTPGVYSNSCPLSRRCHPTISSFVIPFSHLQSFLSSGFFQMSQLFASGRQRIGVSASASVLSTNIQDWFPLGWTPKGYPCSPRDSQESSPTPQFKSINSLALSFIVQLSHPYVDYWKKHSFD